jgi:hypothetical protein
VSYIIKKKKKKKQGKPMHASLITPVTPQGQFKIAMNILESEIRKIGSVFDKI